MTAIPEKPLYPPYRQPMLEADGTVTRPWLLYFESLNTNVSNVVNPITGVVTHTGALTLNDFVLGNGLSDTKSSGFSIVPPANGGIGASGAPTNGQIPIGNGTVYVPATLTAGAGVSVTNGAGSVTLASTYAPILKGSPIVIAHAAMLTLPTTPVVILGAPGATSGYHLIGATYEIVIVSAYTNVNAAGYFVLAAPGEIVWMSAVVPNDAALPTQYLTSLLTTTGTNVSQVLPYAHASSLTSDWGPIPQTAIPKANYLNQPMQAILNNNGAGNLTGGNAGNSLTITPYYVVESY